MFSKMKKYFLILAALTAGLFVSCNNGNDKGPDKPPIDPTDPDIVTLSAPIYYGEKITENVGYYSMTLTKGDDKLRLDMFSGVASDPTKAKPLGGTYKLGTVEEATSETYFVAKQNEDTEGTLFWDNGTPVFVTAGTVMVQIGTGNTYTITLNLTAGDTTIDWKYSGSIVFEDKSVRPPRKPLTGNDYQVDYQGEYFLGSKRMGMLRFVMNSVEEPNTTLQIFMTIPYPEDEDNVAIPNGTFGVEKDPQDEYKIMESYVDGGSFQYTFEVERNSSGMPTGVVVVTGGTATISTEGGKLSITTNFNGNLANPSSGAVIGTEEGIIYTLETESIPPVLNLTKPLSNLENDVEITVEEYPNIFISDPFYLDQAQTMIIWRMVFTTEGLTVVEASDFGTTGSLNLVGEGKLLGIQFITPAESEGPEGTFPFNDKYPNETYTVGTSIPGALGNGLDMLGIGNGTWYAEVEIVDGRLVAVVNAGAMVSEGSVEIKLNDTTKVMTAIVDMQDKYGHKVGGTLDYNLATEASLQSVANSGLFIKKPTQVAPVSNFTRYSLPLF